jgi:hypothetical protein
MTLPKIKYLKTGIHNNTLAVKRKTGLNPSLPMQRELLWNSSKGYLNHFPWDNSSWCFLSKIYIIHMKRWPAA